MRAFARVGASPRVVCVADALAGTPPLNSADILCLPGGFAFGDHLGAGAVAGMVLSRQLTEPWRRCLDRPIICIGNGFQTAVRAGAFGAEVRLEENAHGSFADVPSQQFEVVDEGGSLWLAGLRGAELQLPVAHGSGRFMWTRNDHHWRRALLYAPPASPNGSMDRTAGITARGGALFGLMGHPERSRRTDAALEIFANGVRAVR